MDHKEEEELTEEERKAAWAEYEAEKKVDHLKCFLFFVLMLVIWKSIEEEKATFGIGESSGTKSPDIRVCLQALATFGGRVGREERRKYFPLKE